MTKLFRWCIAPVVVAFAGYAYAESTSRARFGSGATEIQYRTLKRGIGSDSRCYLVAVTKEGGVGLALMPECPLMTDDNMMQ